MSVTAPPPVTRPPRAEPGVTTLPDGRTIRQLCLPVAPVPFQGPSISPEHTVGGPALARSGVVTDLTPGTPAPPEMPHVAYVLADLDTGAVLVAKAAHALLRPASTMKTLTALVTLPVLDPATVVVGTAEDAAADGTRVGIVAGNRYTVDDLFNGLIMVSGNDAAYALAHAYGGRERLIADMNAKAAQLGAYDTLAVDPSGLDADGQRVSAYDLALIGRAVMALPDFRRRSTQLLGTFPGATITVAAGGHSPTTSVVGPYQIGNHNPVLQGYPGIVGIKNGYTTKARNTLIVAAARGGHTLLLAELGSPVPQTEPTKALLDWGFAYAAQARPVGKLVAPGTAVRPPEWGPPGQGATVTPPTDEPTGTETEGPDPTAAAAPPEGSTGPPAQAAGPPSGEPLEYQLAARVSSWWGGLGAAGPVGAGIGALLVAGAGTAAARRRARRRSRGSFEP